MTFSELRKRKGLSQVDLAKSLGVDQSTVSLWERGKTFPRRDMAFRLAVELGCTLDDLYCAARITDSHES